MCVEWNQPPVAYTTQDGWMNPKGGGISREYCCRHKEQNMRMKGDGVIKSTGSSAVSLVTGATVDRLHGRTSMYTAAQRVRKGCRNDILPPLAVFFSLACCAIINSYWLTIGCCHLYDIKSGDSPPPRWRVWILFPIVCMMRSVSYPTPPGANNLLMRS